MGMDVTPNVTSNGHSHKHCPVAARLLRRPRPRPDLARSASDSGNGCTAGTIIPVTGRYCSLEGELLSTVTPKGLP